SLWRLKMKPFDLEAAKRGEPIEYLAVGYWVPCSFIGATSLQYPVIEQKDGSVFETFGSRLRMAPKKVTVRYRVALCQGPHDQYVFAVKDGDPEPSSRGCGFIQWLCDWQTA